MAGRAGEQFLRRDIFIRRSGWILSRSLLFYVAVLFIVINPSNSISTRIFFVTRAEQKKIKLLLQNKCMQYKERREKRNECNPSPSRDATNPPTRFRPKSRART